MFTCVTENRPPCGRDRSVLSNSVEVFSPNTPLAMADSALSNPARSNNRIAYAFACLITLITLFVIIPKAAHAQPDDGRVVLDKIVAVVNKEAITWFELHTAMKREMAPNLAGMDDKQQKQVLMDSQKPFLEQMVRLRVQLQEARKLGIRTGEKDVQGAISNIRNKHGLDEQKFRQAIAKQGLSWDSYKAMLTEQIMVSRLVDREVRANLRPSRQEIMQYQKETGSQDTVTYAIQQIFFKQTANSSAVQTKAQSAWQRLKDGSKFAALAKEISEGPNADRGGDLGRVRADDLSKEFQDVLQSMRPGNFSKPFSTSRGWHIIFLQQIMDINDAVREKIFAKRYDAWITELIDQANIEIRLD